MARIVFSWELGGGMGHLARLQPIAHDLLSRGHRIDFIARNVEITQQLANKAIAICQAPRWQTATKPISRVPVRTFAHVLLNIGYSDTQQLTNQVLAWRSLITSIKPDILVCDSSPTALLAARGLGIRVVSIGTGFHLPPSVYPLPAYRFFDRAANDVSNKLDEVRLTATINETLTSLGIAPLEFLGEIFDSKLAILTAIDELDHFDGRTAANYTGPFPQFAGDEPAWPTGDGPRIFAYLKSFPMIDHLLNELKLRSFPTLIYAPDVPLNLQNRYAGDTLQFHSNPIAMAYAAPACDLMISHAGYGAPFDALLAGKPILSFPLFIDQYITARNIDAIGAGAYLAPGEGQTIAGVLDKALACGNAAEKFRKQHRDLDRLGETKKASALILG